MSGTCRGWTGRVGRGGASDRRVGEIGRGGVGLSADLSSRHRGVHSCRHRRADKRRLARHHPCSSGPGSCRGGRRCRALQASGGLGADALLHIGGTLGRTPRPLSQTLDLTRLGEGQQRQQRDPQQRGEAGDRAYLGKGARQRQCKRQRVQGVHTFREELMAPGSL